MDLGPLGTVTVLQVVSFDCDLPAARMRVLVVLRYIRQQEGEARPGELCKVFLWKVLCTDHDAKVVGVGLRRWSGGLLLVRSW